MADKHMHDYIASKGYAEGAYLIQLGVECAAAGSECTGADLVHAGLIIRHLLLTGVDSDLLALLETDPSDLLTDAVIAQRVEDLIAGRE